MPTGTITAVNVSNGAGKRFGFVSCTGKRDLRFDESDFVDAPLFEEHRGRRVTYNEQGNAAKRVRLAD
jgi:hypothetical protein